jgi:TolA-binding protein
MVAQHAASQSLAAIHQVLMKSEEGGSSIIIKLSGNPAYKVIGIGKREILIALKDTELSKELYNKEITGDGLTQRIEISKKPNNVSCLLVKLRKPYIGIDHQIEASKGILRVQVTSTASSTKKTLKPPKIQSPKSESPPRSAEGGPSPRPAPARQCQAVAGGSRGSDKSDGPQTTCPPVPHMPARKLPAVPIDGRRVAGSQDPKSGPDSPPLPAETAAPVTPSRPGGIDQLLNPDFRDTTPDKDVFLEAVGYFQVGRWEEAIRILGEIIKTYPKSPHLERAYFLLARSYDNMFKNNISEHFVEVNRYYQDAISRFPNSVFVPDAMVSIGKCCSSVENHYEALAYYSLVCENYKMYAAAPEALFERGKILTLVKKPQEAVKSFQQVERLYPETPFASMARISRAKVLFDMNNFKGSLAVLDEIMTAEPSKVYENPEILLYSGYNYYELGRLEKARDVLCKVLNYCPDIESNHLILARIADSYREQGMESKALKLYNMVLRRYPDSEGGLISRLRLSADIQKVEEMLFSQGVIKEIASCSRPALETYKEIIKTHGDNPLSQLAGLRLALQRQKKKDYEGSVNMLGHILAKYPDTPLKEQIKSALHAPLEAI